MPKPELKHNRTGRTGPPRRKPMIFTRRHVLAGAIAAPAILTFSGARAATMLKISHQFPGSSGKDGDFRDILCRRFAEELASKSGGDLGAQVYAGSSLMKVNSQ